MATNLIQRGDTLTLPAPASVTSGQGVVVGAIFGVAAGDAAANEPMDLMTAGVFDLPKVGANAFAVGDLVYFNTSTKLATSTASGAKKIGVAVEAAGEGTGSVATKLIESI